MEHRFASGIIAAPVLPFKADGTIDWHTLERYLVAIATGGAVAIAMNMAASEGGSLDVEEQLEVIRRAKAVLANACPIISGIIASHTGGAVTQAKRLQDAGAEGFVVFPPLPVFSSGPLPTAMVVDYHRAIAESVDRPIIAFQTSGVAYPPGAIAALAEIPTVVSVKDAAFDIERTAEILEEVNSGKRPIGVMTGNDTFILEALLLGCSGALIGFAGTATAKLVAMQRLAVSGAATEAYAIWRELGPLARLIWSPPLRDFRARLKYVLRRQGVIPSDFTRAPQGPTTPRDREKIDAIMTRHRLAAAEYLPAGVRGG